MTTVNAPLRRSRSHRIVAGIIGGLAEYFDIDVALARILYVIASVCSAAFPGILVYIICWILIPQENDEQPRSVST